jgi:hypothetical protein
MYDCEKGVFTLTTDFVLNLADFKVKIWGDISPMEKTILS